VTFNWQASNAFLRGQIPQQVKQYLLDEGSLTERLLKASGGDFRVELLHQGFAKPTRSERKLLGIAEGQYAWIREVQLLCFGKPWVYARSVVPVSSLKGELGHLRQLQNSSLGALLFKDPTLKRGQFELCCLDRPPKFDKKIKNTAIYGRRSVFHLYNKPLLVAELFLPDCKL
jgi:chorismate--pyruvate lyase